jgi:hypothetical protein
MIALALALAANLASAASLESSSYITLKAVYLERISRFVEWPAAADSASPSTEFVIGVLGEDRFVSTLEDVYAKRPILGKRVRVVVMTESQEIPDCQILVLPGAVRPRLRSVLAQLKGRPILTVSDNPGFAEAGVQINLHVAENRIRFEVNERAVREAGLQIGYQLLAYARIVDPLRGTP